jgi:hypothetical protein
LEVPCSSEKEKEKPFCKERRKKEKGLLSGVTLLPNAGTWLPRFVFVPGSPGKDLLLFKKRRPPLVAPSRFDRPPGQRLLQGSEKERKRINHRSFVFGPLRNLPSRRAANPLSQLMKAREGGRPRRSDSESLGFVFFSSKEHCAQASSLIRAALFLFSSKKEKEQK